LEVKTTIPAAIWDNKRFKWKSFLSGEYDSLKGCPNWLYTEIGNLISSGQSHDNINIFNAKEHQYAVIINNKEVQIFSKKRR
jgi:hypothetical protein